LRLKFEHQAALVILDIRVDTHMYPARSIANRFGLGTGDTDLANAFLLLGALPLVVMVGSESALFWFATSSEAASIGTYNGRTQGTSLIDLFAATTLLGSACLAIVAYFIADCSQRLGRDAYARLLTWWVVLSAGVYVLLFQVPLSLWSTRSWRILGAAPELCPAARVAGNLETGGCGTELVNWLLSLSTPLIVLASVAALLGAVSTLAASTAPPSPSEWKMQRQAADVWLFIGSGLLIVGLVFHHAWGRWLAANWGLSETKEFVALIAAYTSFKGVQASVLIAAYYIPIVCIFAARADAIAQAANPGRPERAEKYKERHSLTFPISAVIKSIGGMLAPFIASMLGPISDLAKAIH
jgi:hypothetical protein